MTAALITSGPPTPPGPPATPIPPPAKEFHLMSCQIVAADPNAAHARAGTTPAGFSVRPTNTDRVLRRLCFMFIVHIVCQTAIRYLPLAWWPLASAVPVAVVAATFLKCLHDAVCCFDRYLA